MNTAPQMRGVAPFLLVSNVQEAAAYFTNVLGFSATQFWGEPPDFTIARREHISVMLRQVQPGETFAPNAAFKHGLDAYFWVRDADALHKEFVAKGADVVCPPQDEPYMMREFSVRGPDGRVFTFGHDTSNQDATHG